MRALTKHFNGEGSTRKLAVLRIGAALLVWARFADDFALYNDRGWIWATTGAAIYLSSTALLVGFRSRLAALLTGLSIAFAVFYLGVVQRNYSLVHHHISLLMFLCLLLALGPCGRSLSVDAWRDPQPQTGPIWPCGLIALQASAVWFWGAVDKLKPGWLSGERLEAIIMAQYYGSDWPTWPGFSTVMLGAAISTVVVEFVLAIGMFFPRWHRLLIPLAVVFHAGIYFVVPVATFTATMYLLLLAYIPADRFHAAIDRLLGGPAPRRMPP